MRYEWPGLPAAVCTPLVLASHGPLGGACGAQFLAQRLLPTPGSLSGGGDSGDSEDSELLLQVGTRNQA
jgi:hypothetical protein